MLVAVDMDCPWSGNKNIDDSFDDPVPSTRVSKLHVLTGVTGKNKRTESIFALRVLRSTVTLA